MKFIANNIILPIVLGACLAFILGTVHAQVTPFQGGTGVANNNAATLTRSGNHALTLTTTGATGLTLPTSGTVCASGNACSGTTITATTGFVSYQMGFSPVTTDVILSKYASKQLLISGDGTGAGANVGWIIGKWNGGNSSAIYSSLVTPSNTNYAFLADASTSQFNATTTMLFNINDGTKLSLNSTAGQGATITAGTATTDVNALNITQTWNEGSTAFTAIRANITNTNSAATTKLLDLRIGDVSYFNITKDGVIATNVGYFDLAYNTGMNVSSSQVTLAANNVIGLTLTTTAFSFASAVVTPASSGTRYLCIDTSGVVSSSASACSGT